MNTLLARYAFDPWGRRSLVAGTDVSDVGFTGHRSATTAPLWLTQYRAYDPDLGRWISDDPIGLEGGVNLTAYVRNSPISNIDPFGLQLYQPGAPPLKPVPSGCVAGDWQFVGHSSRNVGNRPRWQKIGEWPLFVVGRRNGRPASGNLGPCLCQWTRVGTVRLTELSESWQRTVTCCDQSYQDPGITYKIVRVPVPSLFNTTYRITPGWWFSGTCNCELPQ
jgi:RHS repeat-associated protein